RHWRPNPRITFFSSWCKLWAWVFSLVAWRRHPSAMPPMRARVFLRLVQRGSIGDPVAALFRGKGINAMMGRADQPCLHRGRRLDGNECIHEGRVDAAAKLTEGLGEDKVGLRRIDLVVAQTTGVHDRKIGAQALADIFI